MSTPTRTQRLHPFPYRNKHGRAVYSTPNRGLVYANGTSPNYNALNTTVRTGTLANLFTGLGKGVGKGKVLSSNEPGSPVPNPEGSPFEGSPSEGSPSEGSPSEGSPMILHPPAKQSKFRNLLGPKESNNSRRARIQGYLVAKHNSVSNMKANLYNGIPNLDTSKVSDKFTNFRPVTDANKVNVSKRLLDYLGGTRRVRTKRVRTKRVRTKRVRTNKKHTQKKRNVRRKY